MAIQARSEGHDRVRIQIKTKELLHSRRGSLMYLGLFCLLSWVAIAEARSKYVAGFCAAPRLTMRAGGGSQGNQPRGTTTEGSRGFGHAVKSSKGPKKDRSSSNLKSRTPNSFSSMGKAIRHRGKFGNAPLELGLLDMSNKLMQQHEAIKERYSGHKPVQAGGGRQRGAKKAAAYQALSSYSLHFLKLLEEELLYEEAEVMQRLRHWTRGRLQEEGLAVFGVVARPRGRLYKEYILRFTLPASKKGGSKAKSSWGYKNSPSNAVNGGARAPPLHYHRLGPGDIISITPDRQNPLQSNEVIEGLVLERGSFYVDVVVKEIPPGVQWRRGDPTGGERFRLDLYMNRISFQRMVAAVHQVTGFETGYTVSPELREILVRSFAERFDVVFPSHQHHHRHGHNSHHHHHQSPSRDTSVLSMSPYTVGQSSSSSSSQTHHQKPVGGRHAQGGRRRREGMGSADDVGGSDRKSNWEAMASAVPKTFYAKKDAERMVNEEVKRFSLNPSQESALRMALTRKLSLIQGPPGTGKTRTACHLINIAVRLSQRRDVGKVLAVAFSNVAADNLLEGCLRLGLNAVRVGRAATVRPELRNHTLDAMLTHHESVSTFKKKLEHVRGKAPKDIQGARRDLEDAELMAAISILSNADVVISTCVGAANEAIISAASVTVSSSRGGVLRAVKFPTVIVDEASQATEPATLIPLTQGCEQLVLVGDHYQLPPTIKSFRAAQQGLGVSMFTRLAMAGIQPSMLTIQYRMHPIIAQFPSRRFYGGLLKSHSANRHRPRPEGFPWPNPTLPIAFVAVGEEDGAYYEQRTKGNQTSYMNRKEGEVMMDVLGSVLQKGQLECKDIGIVTPYSAQVKHITELAQSKVRPASALGDLEIKSVDAYQGREKEMIMISAVRSNKGGKVGFLGDWRRLNVAITRAKRGIVVIGDPRTLRHDPHWGAYLRWCAKNGCILSAKEMKDELRRYGGGGSGGWGKKARQQQPRQYSPPQVGGRGDDVEEESEAEYYQSLRSASAPE